MTGEPRTKGAAISDFLAWVGREHGEAAVRAAWSRLSSSARLELGTDEQTVMPFRWYSASTVNDLCDALTVHLTPIEQEVMAHEGTRAIVEHTLRGLYGSMFRLLVGPRRYLDKVQTVWGLFHDTGVISGEVVAPREHVTRLRAWRGRHPFVVLLNKAFAHALYESMGCRGIVVETTEERDAQGIVDVQRIRWMDGPV
jgi:hypothetical protein